MPDSSKREETPSREVRPGPHVVSRLIGQGAVLIHLRTNQIYELNPQGARIWQLIQDGMERDAIVECLEREFDADRDRLTADVDALLSRLTDAELVIE